MELTALGQEYLEQEKEVRKMVRGVLDKLKVTHDADARMELKRRLSVLYTMAGDCRATGNYLLHYYDREVC